MKIGEFSKLSGYSFDTIRYYESLGIFQATKKGYYKSYTTEHLDICFFIERLKTCGITLKEIKKIFDLSNKIVSVDNLNDSQVFDLEELLNILKHTKSKATEIQAKSADAIITLDKMIGKINKLTDRQNENS